MILRMHAIVRVVCAHQFSVLSSVVNMCTFLSVVLCDKLTGASLERPLEPSNGDADLAIPLWKTEIFYVEI